MIAMGRILKKRFPDARTVFIGPCAAEKDEMNDPAVAGAIDAVLTYPELAALFEERCVDISRAPEEACYGAPRVPASRLFPLQGGMLKTILPGVDISDPDVTVAEGVGKCVEALKALAEGRLKTRFLGVRFCDGCIAGPMMPKQTNIYERTRIVLNYYNAMSQSPPPSVGLELGDPPDLTRTFTTDSIEVSQPPEEEIKEMLRRVNKTQPSDELNCGACGYATCRERAAAACRGLVDTEMCIPHIIGQFERARNERRDMSQGEKEKPESQLQSVKLASIGLLAAGVAHELNNPLGSIIGFTHLLREKITSPDLSADTKLSKIEEFSSIILGEAERAKTIVQNLLDFSRQSDSQLAPTDINHLIRHTLSLLEKQVTFQKIKIYQRLSGRLPNVLCDANQLQQVFTNIMQNAGEAMLDGGILVVSTVPEEYSRMVRIVFSDTGCGIPKEDLPNIFDPFFTTKKRVWGTGMGLSISHGIVQKIKGTIEAESEPGKGTTFTIKLPADGDSAFWR
jgi:signal transduction histidine kinase